MVHGNGTGSKNSVVYLDRAKFSGYKILSFWANPQKFVCIKNISTHKEIVTSRSVLNLFVASTSHMARNKIINGDIHLDYYLSFTEFFEINFNIPSGCHSIPMYSIYA